MVSGAFAGWACYETFSDPSQWWRVRIIAAFAFASALVLPSTIATTPSGVESRRLFGLWRNSIRWQEIETVIEMSGEIAVIGPKRRIKHTANHENPELFEEELEKHGFRVGRVGIL
ncbi:MAG: hypothetical protein U0Q16_32225 [Bryobacteraceae bacterium]